MTEGPSVNSSYKNKEKAMCTNIVVNAEVAGWGKDADRWFDVKLVTVVFDHALHAPLEHAVTIDFTDPAVDFGPRVAVELTPDGARALMRALESAVRRAEEQGVA
jgi:hypothetical protein